MSCVTRVTKTLEESKGVTAARFDPTTSTWAVSTGEGFKSDDVVRRIRAAGDEHSRRQEQANDPPWVARWVSQDGEQRKH